ncbi:C45 family autoproteolytic acyltransferase/hydrolase [Streptomyces sp. NPDC048288]|uniref:C45 family autoproteolytic acyltransferase/hydolase n=1 Tax=Streptomyces sp. NPDC048288 TaxID=3365529 RepID=UPI0037113B1A
MTGGAGIPLVRVHGEPFAAGHAHGERLAAPLRSFLGDSLARLGRVMAGPVTLAGLRPVIAAHRAAVTAAAPELAEEVRGIAAGAGIEESEAWLFQLRREIMGYQRVPVRTMGDCTTYARSGSAAGGHPVLAQTVDLNGDLDDYLAVLDVARPGTGRRSLVLSFGGLLGYLGLNSDGLAIGINLVLGGDWGTDGLPPYLAVRHLLDTAGSVEEALEVLAGLRLTSSRVLTLCDPRRAVWVEHLDGEYRVGEAATPVHTNHYLHPDFTTRDQINVFARNSSLRRLDAGTAGLAGLPPGAGPEEHFAVLAEPPIRVPDSGDIRRERTVAAVVMLPARGELHVRPGDPALSTTQVFRL